MKGVDPELVELMNEKLRMFKQETEIMIAERDGRILELSKKIGMFE